ncbi:tRNA (5-methylaminomethyl-2-thiouridine)(34)-methyltransferase MnmD [Siansivirga zeaxanthinifaciens]|uniref:SAM-dependent methyltransferase n=1 Tax=Siansivirga zeaxanthinifaciens CC-SAMT-1 TaxID=1454006 RepID=A0A0C5WC50_9FLAO|nr:tRNA (5-methylaminomethyl-2-thiouridine)(34)-methyltransferase MnmD [Siansivirga zeaxanthinifaciens]AJR04648.1 SAM-dependent methyltransferase [Siansivirga zeaxanthinifaciens CC-SAMT-1]
MKREIVITGDGSSTIHLPDWDEQYHSKHGAIQEAYHVFIKNGLDFYRFNEATNTTQNNKAINILEIGFGTGLNAFITFLEAEQLKLKIQYTGIEAYPVSQEEVSQLNYPNQLQAAQHQNYFQQLHTSPWEAWTSITNYFSINKKQLFFHEIEDENKYNLIYFDAFGARVQPELWTASIFEKMYRSLQKNGVLVTYAAKGSVRRAMQEVGFLVERLPGPPGKREMLRAIKK